MRLAGNFMKKEELEVTECHQASSGLYQPEYEHDACGVGMIVDIHGNKSHELVDAALKVLENMKHRGAEGADNKTGDGAGIMLQIPHEFILLQGIPVPEKGKYGTGLVFLPKDAKEQESILSILIEEIEREGLSLMHLRSVPVNSSILGKSALEPNRTLNRCSLRVLLTWKTLNVPYILCVKRLNVVYTIRTFTLFLCPAKILYIKVCCLRYRCVNIFKTLPSLTLPADWLSYILVLVQIHFLPGAWHSLSAC